MPYNHLLIDEQAQDLLFREAHTAGTFTDEPVSGEQIEALYDLVKWAPTSFNQQPLRVALIRSKDAKGRLVPLMWDANQARTAAAPLTAVLAADLQFHELLPELYPVFPQAKDVHFAQDEARIEAALMNTTLQVAYFIIGVRAVGLAAGPMTGFDADKVTEQFFDLDRYRALAVVNIGNPAAGASFDRQPRLAYDRVFSTH